MTYDTNQMFRDVLIHIAISLHILVSDSKHAELPTVPSLLLITFLVQKRQILLSKFVSKRY